MLDNRIDHDFKNDLGSFEVRVWHPRGCLSRIVSPEEVLEWEGEEDGLVEFYPSGDHEGVSLVFREKACVDAAELVELDYLLDGLMYPAKVSCLLIHHLMHKHKIGVSGLDCSDIGNTEAMVSTARTFYEAQQMAVIKLEHHIPQEYPNSFKQLASNERDHELLKYLHTSKFIITQAKFSDQVGGVVSLASKF